MHQGTFYECFQTYLKSIDVEQRKRLALFACVADAAIGRWLRGANIPAGKSALRLHYLMEWVGFQITDWPITNTDVLTVGRAVSFRAMSIEQVMAAFNGDLSETVCTQMLGGTLHIRSDRLPVFAKLAAEYGPLTPAAQAQWQDLTLVDDRARLINDVARRVVELLPLAQTLASDDCSAKDRHTLRVNSGNDSIFKLYNTLGLLCGERAREMAVHEAGLILRKH